MVLVAGGVWLVKNKPGATQVTTQALQVDLTNGGDWVRGNPQAPKVVVEFSDFQCPACKTFEPLVVQAQQELGDQMVLVYKQFPLTSIHQNSQLAAQAAEAAGLQGKFWEMHDLLFKNQNSWAPEQDPTATFTQYAQELALNTTQFSSDLTSESVKQSISEDQSVGNQLGVNSTPTFYVNGNKLPNVNSYQDFKNFIQQH